MEINLEAARTKALADFAARDPEALAANAGAALEAPGRMAFAYFGRAVAVCHPGGEVFWEGGEALPPREQVLLLHYLCRATGTAPAGEWISFAQVPGGAIYVGPFRQRCVVPLVRRFGGAPHVLARAAAVLGGQPLALGDVAFALPALPRVPLAVVFWRGDEEFPPNASLLFDRAVPNYLSAEDAVVLAQMAVKYLGLAAQGAG